MKKRRLYLFSLLLALTACTVTSQTADLHAPYHTLMKQHTDESGQVDYAALQPQAQVLDAYLQQLGQVDPASFPSKEEQMLFYVNLYNAATISLILEHYPTASIMELDGGKTWDVKRVKVNGELLSLNEIEHEILRKRWDDPRVHVAVNCASASCPALFLAETEDELNAMLDESMRSFINDTTKNVIATDTTYLSKLFDWYAEDFGNVRAYVRRYAAHPELITDETVIRYQPYDWSLNSKAALD